MAFITEAFGFCPPKKPGSQVESLRMAYPQTTDEPKKMMLLILRVAFSAYFFCRVSFAYLFEFL